MTLADRRTAAAWRRTLYALRLECPPLLPVRVRSPWRDCGHFGLTNLSRDGAHFNVTIPRRVRDRSTGRVRAVTRQELLDSLCHEWAHVLTWHADDHEAHGAEWGRQYARCYRAVVED